jgi:hypothetical protein
VLRAGVDQVGADRLRAGVRARQVEQRAAGVEPDPQRAAPRRRVADAQREQAQRHGFARRGRGFARRHDRVFQHFALGIEHAQVAQVGARHAAIERLVERETLKRRLPRRLDREAPRELLWRHRRRGRMRRSDRAEQRQQGPRPGLHACVSRAWRGGAGDK